MTSPPARHRTRTAPEGSRPWRPRPAAISSACFSRRPTGCRRSRAPTAGPCSTCWSSAAACAARRRPSRCAARACANVRVIDRAARGDEGPWGTYARMDTLRSPKHLTGPDLGVPVADASAPGTRPSTGADGWQRLHKIADRRLARLPAVGARHRAGCRSRTASRTLLDLARRRPRAGANWQDRGGARPCARASSCWRSGATAAARRRWPAFPSLARSAPQAAARVFHSADAIDFAAWQGRRIGVLGAGASAFDNAACALEAGARAGDAVRAPRAPAAGQQEQVDVVPRLPARLRGRWTTRARGASTPTSSTSRCRRRTRRCGAATRHDGFALRLGEPWLDVAPDADGVDRDHCPRRATASTP